MKFIEKLKKTYAYYKALGKKKKPQEIYDVKIRPDYYAFLTCPNPVLPSEIQIQKKQ